MIKHQTPSSCFVFWTQLARFWLVEVRKSQETSKSMGDLQDPTDWRYVNVPYFWPYLVGIFPYISAEDVFPGVQKSQSQEVEKG